MDREFTAKASLAAAATYITYLIGEVDRMLGILVIVMALDYISGVLAAWYGRRLDSKIGFRGIVKKVLMLILVAVAHQVDALTGHTGITRTAVIWFLVANDGISITENAAECGVEIPLLTRALQLIKDRADEKAQAEGGQGG